MLHSIRFRLSASYVLVTVLTAAVVGALTVSGVSQQLHTEETAGIRAQAQRVADEAFQHFVPFARKGGLQELAVSSSELGGFRVRILDPAREVLADSATEADTRRGALRMMVPRLPAATTGSESADEVDAATRRLMELFSDEASLVIVRTSRFGRAAGQAPRQEQHATALTSGPMASGDVRAMASAGLQRVRAPRGDLTVTVPVGGVQTPLGFVELTSAGTVTSAATAATRKAVLFAALGAVLVAAAFGVFMGQGMTLGLRALTETAAEMEKGHLTARARVRSRDEIGALSKQFNRMAAQLETSFKDLAAERDTLKRFAADASHELRTPLTALMTFNELLRNAAASDPRAREEFLTESHRQLERLEDITSSLLDLSRLDAGLVTPELVELDAGELVAQCMRLWSESAVAAGIALGATLPAGPLPLFADRARMETALSNLISNAIKFTPRGGEVRVGVEPSDPGEVCFWVEDTGPGIPEQELPHVFERFFRGASAPGTGSGLGLAIVRSVAELHAGRVEVTSRAGHGSTFRLVIPRRTT